VRHLFLHIGTHKTGSTAIQHALAANRKALSKSGYALIPRPEAARELVHSRSEDPLIVERMEEQFYSSLKLLDMRRVDAIVLSWEGFSGDHQRGYCNTATIAEALRKLATGFIVTVVVYIRRQDEFAESLYAQHIQYGHSHSFSEFLRQFDVSAFDWARLLQSYTGAFGRQNVLARRYISPSGPTDTRLLDDFSKAIGLPFVLSLPGKTLRNPSMNRQALELARLANPYMSTEERRFLREILQQSSTRSFDDSLGFFTDQGRQDFLEQYASSNASVQADFFSDTGDLFPRIEEARQSSGGFEADPGPVLAKIVRFLQANGANKLYPSMRPNLRQYASERLARFPRLRRISRSLARLFRLYS